MGLFDWPTGGPGRRVENERISMGYTVAEATQILNVDYKTLRKWLRQTGIETEVDELDGRRRLISDEQLLELARLYKRNLSIAQPSPALEAKIKALTRQVNALNETVNTLQQQLAQAQQQAQVNKGENRQLLIVRPRRQQPFTPNSRRGQNYTQPLPFEC